MIEQIIALREEGFSFRKIAKELNTTVGKVQYRYQKYQEEQHVEHEELTVVTEECDNECSLPLSYEHDELTLLSKGPTSVFAFWDTKTSTRNMLEHHCRKAWSELPKCLRIYDVTLIEFNGHNAHRYLDVNIPEMTNNWYFHGLEANRTYIVDFGIYTNDQTFLSILRSNPIDTPRMRSEDGGSRIEAVYQWREGNQHEPQWLEHFSTYSYYESVK
ncbi:DUF4912 domain-containing protein [Halalkalibacter urbisdiaboli]|uniref:DUF4912 domain-containing protein n=1 Tax=Halalkalibacter urbisdiaboli TaxID=1960589 RepID=UPI000B44189B|nr:DUF4912 domain-containing protein [Halalkalibacter urbisdiaboli]